MNNPFLILENHLNRIEELLLEIKQRPASEPNQAAPTSDIINVKQAAEFLGLATQTVYQHIHKIPHLKRHGKLYFRRSELLIYLEQGVPVSKKSQR